MAASNYIQFISRARGPDADVATGVLGYHRIQTVITTGVITGTGLRLIKHRDLSGCLSLGVTRRQHQHRRQMKN
jgi:hypothetical protein